mmetsp:Transcript_17650/g.24369  ORF Transcript_17650/g.24369 Transcript_17650/m.24369 type:complete len:272 (+) Transcript_17650:20-835(+)|eukprot:CAMPEP_0196584840 /NCGR_PEP_ID=MMETSP1081-20130531/48669_1 /TAXON_ID=36882 /ORGANISM="Pyramimonas amylifera, Strain CCMP720" /LENGTH=271 /DNA_ID=CAMNT_0041906193 /DNA_START=19 /DNA_END=834 /DNA_ORIENTATION=-
MRHIQFYFLSAVAILCAHASIHEEIDGHHFVNEEPDDEVGLASASEAELRHVAELLSQEPLSPDQQTVLLHKYQKADPQMQALIKTSVEMESLAPLLRCAACDASLAELQIALTSSLKAQAKLEMRGMHWAVLWSEMHIGLKVATVKDLFTPELCGKTLSIYGLHAPSNSYVPTQLKIPLTISTQQISQSLVDQCKFFSYAFSSKIALGLGNDTARIHKQIISQGGTVEEELMGLWHAVRKSVCNSITRAHGACHQQQHPMMRDQPRHDEF